VQFMSDRVGDLLNGGGGGGGVDLNLLRDII